MSNTSGDRWRRLWFAPLPRAAVRILAGGFLDMETDLRLGRIFRGWFHEFPDGIEYYRELAVIPFPGPAWPAIADDAERIRLSV